MRSKLLYLLMIVALSAATSFAQGWTNLGSVTDTSYNSGAHGIAVDPDGKIWTADYYKTTQIIVGEDTSDYAALYCFNPDGSEAAFSPVYISGTDTLNGSCRGMGTAADGNILYVQSGPNKIFKINYQTGAVMATGEISETGSSPTGPAVADDGTIFIGPVVGGGTTQIAMYDGNDLSYIGSAVTGPPAIARTMAVSGDGLTIYWTPFTAGKTYVYTKPDEFSAFELADSIHIGMSIESVSWQPGTGLLWVSNDVARGSDVSKENLTWYGYDVAKKTFVGAFAWDPSGQAEDLLIYPRAIDFSNDGKTAYIGAFKQSGTGSPARFQVVEFDSMAAGFTATLPSDLGWTNQGSLADTSYNSGAHGIAVDPDGKIWTADYYKTTQVISGEDTSDYAALYCFNPDGSEAAFSPVYISGTDTLNGNCRGIGTAADGNILYVQSGPNKIFKINYQTGAVMATGAISETGSSPTGPAVADDGTIFIGPVVGGGTTQIAMYDGNDLSYLGSAVTGPPAIARTMAVSGDGLTIYWTPFTAGKTYIYTKPDEFSAFEMSDSVHIGMSIESVAWEHKTGLLWVSNDVARGSDVSKANLAWYGYDTGAKTFTDAFAWDPAGQAEDLLIYPRAINFSNDGNTAYIGAFKQSGTGSPARVQVVSRNEPLGIVEVTEFVPSKYKLRQNYPNPFNPTTTIEYRIPATTKVKLTVYNMLGQRIATLVNQEQIAGTYRVDFDASNLATGMYVYTIEAGDFRANKKMMFIK